MSWLRGKLSVPDESSQLMKLAEKLGVEQRASVRVRYPRVTEVCRLPQIAFLDYKFIVYNISTGGCALLDSDEVLGPQVGHEIQLTLTWPDGVERVNARIVSRVDHRRHIQFLNLAPARIKQLANSMSAGVRGLSMRRHALSSLQGPSMEANELWSSPAGDSLVLETSVHRLAQVQFCSHPYVIFRESWPLRGSEACSSEEFEKLILFLVNIPSPSTPLVELLMALESRLLGGHP